MIVIKAILFWLTVFTFSIAIAGIYIMFIPAVILSVICRKIINLKELITISFYDIVYKNYGNNKKTMDY